MKILNINVTHLPASNDLFYANSVTINDWNSVEPKSHKNSSYHN